jgi:hypothetical protein
MQGIPQGASTEIFEIMPNCKTLFPIGWTVLLAFILLVGCKEQKTDKPAPNPILDPSKESLGLTPYNRESTIFSFCWLANVNSGMVAPPAQLQQHATQGMAAILANDTVEALIGKWTPIWGPVAYSHTDNDTSITDNTMVLLQGKDPSDSAKVLYVVAIAGTNSISIFDWAFEDFAALEMVQWPAPPRQGENNLPYFTNPTKTNNHRTTDKGSYISVGITTGINNLFNNMRDGDKGTLIEFLKRDVGNQPGAELLVTGHSLGGGLTPVVALALKENQNYWNPAGNFTVTAYPYAGQSPGNNHFAAHLHERMGANHFHGAYNVLDVVPHGYDNQMMPQIPGLYQHISKHLKDECLIGGLVRCIHNQVKPFNYTTLYNASQTFTANFTLPDSIYKNALVSYEKLPEKVKAEIWVEKEYLHCFFERGEELVARSAAFAYMAYVNHIDAYTKQYGVEVFDDIFRRQLQHGKVSGLGALLKMKFLRKCRPHI